MLEKWKQKAIQMNLKKAVIFFIVTSFVLSIVSFAAVYGNFQGRMNEWEKYTEMDRGHDEGEKDFDDEKRSDFSDGEHDKDSKEENEKDWEDISRGLYLSAGDLALIAGCCIIGTVIGVWYWVLVLIAVYRESYRMGVNVTLWMLAALIFNLAALVALYLYAMLKGTCTNCGRVKNGSGKFCGRCGSLLKKECPQCGQAADISSAYCGNCGKKLDETES